MTRSAISLEELGITNSCREHTIPRDQYLAYPKGVIAENTRFGPVLEVVVTAQFGRYGMEVNNIFIIKRWIKILGHYQQGCGTTCNGALVRLHTAHVYRHGRARHKATCRVCTLAGKTWFFILQQKRGRWTHSHRSQEMGAQSQCG